MPTILYSPSIQSDMLLSKLYTDIMYSGDADKVLAPDVQTLSGFLHNCQKPRVCIYAIDDGLAATSGIWLWCHLEPCFSGAFMALWIRPEKRGSKQSLNVVMDLYDAILLDFPVILGTTHQEELVEEHLKAGYLLLGEIPNLWGGKKVWVLTMTRESFSKRKEYYDSLKRREKPLEVPFNNLDSVSSIEGELQ